MGSKLHVTLVYLSHLCNWSPSIASSSKAKKRRTDVIHGLKPNCDKAFKNCRATTITSVNDDSESVVQFGGFIPEGQMDNLEAQAISTKNGNHVGKPMKENQYVVYFI